MAEHIKATQGVVRRTIIHALRLGASYLSGAASFVDKRPCITCGTVVRGADFCNIVCGVEWLKKQPRPVAPREDAS